MHRLFVILTALLLLVVWAAPATAKSGKPDKPDKSAPTLIFGVEPPYAGYEPERGICEAEIRLQVQGAANGSRVVFEAYVGPEVLPEMLLSSQEETLRKGGTNNLLFSYDFACQSEIQLDITHVATLYDRKGKELASVQETHLMNFEIHR
jgi:hypothetical protein